MILIVVTYLILIDHIYIIYKFRLCGEFIAHLHWHFDRANIFRFYIQGILLTTVGTIGLIGNIVSIIVLSLSRMHNSFIQLLIVLAAFDSTFIILAIMKAIFCKDLEHLWVSGPIAKTLYNYYLPYLIHPFTSITFSASIFTTVALSYERHNALCNPIQHRQARAKHSVKRRTLSYAIPILLIAVVLNIPKWFESKYKKHKYLSNSTNPNENEAKQYMMESIRIEGESQNL